jgi:hypothetical protein
MSIVVCKLPKAGLGNQLFPLMKAFTLGQINNFPVIIVGYNQLKIGPYLRKEKSKRKYSNYFNFQKSLLGEQIDKWRVFKNKHLQIQSESIIEQKQWTDKVLYKYEAIPHWNNYFDQLKQYRDLVIELLNKQIKKTIHTQVEKQIRPNIGVHIRMGDFRKLKEGEEFSKVGAVRTPEQYFIDIIKNIRQIHGTSLPVSVFTDGYKHEFEELFLLDNINIVEGNSDIIDMLLLSKSKIIVCSAGSTFSYWAGFLANAPLIMHPDHIHQPIRPDEINEVYYEGSWDNNNSILINNILNIEA